MEINVVQYILNRLSVLTDEELKSLDFESGLSAIDASDIDQDDKAELKRLMRLIYNEVGLRHHGVKGQKWGVRRYQNKDGSLTPAGQKHRAKQSVFGTASTFKIKTRHGEVITADPVKPWSGGKKILNALVGVSEKDELGRRGDANYTLNNPKGEKIGELSLISKNANTAYIDWITVDSNIRGKGYGTDILNTVLRKAKDSGYSKVELNALKEPRSLYERLGFTYTDTSKMGIVNRIRSFEFGCKHMEYDLNQLQHGELYHAGIKGMKWGIRRYQNKDGTLTPAGKQRYRDYSDDALAAEKIRNKKVSQMSNAELKKLNERQNLEKNYSNLNKNAAQKGFSYVATAALVTTTVLTLYNNSNKLIDIGKKFVHKR